MSGTNEDLRGFWAMFSPEQVAKMLAAAPIPYRWEKHACEEDCDGIYKAVHAVDGTVIAWVHKNESIIDIDEGLRTSMGCVRVGGVPEWSDSDGGPSL